MSLLAIGHVLVPFTHTTGTLMAVGVLMGIGNGASSGLVMTLGADLAPPADRARFLGIWRLLADAGAAPARWCCPVSPRWRHWVRGSRTFGAVGVVTAVLMGAGSPGARRTHRPSADRACTGSPPRRPTPQPSDGGVVRPDKRPRRGGS